MKPPSGRTTTVRGVGLLRIHRFFVLRSRARTHINQTNSFIILVEVGAKPSPSDKKSSHAIEKNGLTYGPCCYFATAHVSLRGRK